MNRKTRIVCKPVQIDYVSHSGAMYQIDVWQEVYSSMYKSDCIKWIELQKRRDDKNHIISVYCVFVEEA